MRRRVLPALLALTLAVLLADLAGAPLGPLRDAGTTVLGPVQRFVAPRDSEASALEAEKIRLEERVRRLEEERRTAAREDALPTEGMDSVAARVVALDRAGASGPERLTLDAGRRDGIRTDRAVLAPGGLVGRVVDVSESTADVEVIGSPDAQVGVRTGTEGIIGTLTGSDPTTDHDADDLVVTQLGRDRAASGDEVVTIGSPGQRPYPSGVTVGTVTSVDRDAGQLTDTALVEPAVDLATLDVVAVVTGPTRGGGSAR